MLFANNADGFFFADSLRFPRERKRGYTVIISALAKKEISGYKRKCSHLYSGGNYFFPLPRAHELGRPQYSYYCSREYVAQHNNKEERLLSIIGSEISLADRPGGVQSAEEQRRPIIPGIFFFPVFPPLRSRVRALRSFMQMLLRFLPALSSD